MISYIRRMFKRALTKIKIDDIKTCYQSVQKVIVNDSRFTGEKLEVMIPRVWFVSSSQSDRAGDKNFINYLISMDEQTYCSNPARLHPEGGVLTRYSAANLHGLRVDSSEIAFPVSTLNRVIMLSTGETTAVICISWVGKERKNAYWPTLAGSPLSYVMISESEEDLDHLISMYTVVT